MAKGKRELMAYAKSLGFERHGERNDRHLKFRLPGTNTPQVVCSQTPSDRRALENAKAMLRRVKREAQQQKEVIA